MLAIRHNTYNREPSICYVYSSLNVLAVVSTIPAMSILLIDLPLPGDPAGHAFTQKIAVSHIAVRDADIGQSRNSLRASPGVQFIIPVEQQVSLLIDSEPFHVPRGIALVVDGRARKAAMDKAPTEHSGHVVRPLRILELNARINDDAPLRDQLALPVMLDFKPSDMVNGLLNLLSTGETLMQPQSGTIAISRHLAAARLVELLLASAGKSPPDRSTPPQDEQLAHLRRFLFANMAGQVTNTDMARHLGMSRSAFCQWARTHLDCSPARYMRLLRLERGQEWLAQGEQDMEQIARQTGFSDRYHFSKEFRKHFGHPPAEYAKMCREGAREDFLARAAERLFRLERFNEALAACEQALQENPPLAVRDRLRYQKGLCLQALDRTAEAIAEWQALKGSTMGHRAGMRQCRHLFEEDKTARGLQVLRGLYAAAGDIQKVDVIHLWMDHVGHLMAQRLPQPVRRCLAVRAELFPADFDSMHLAGQALYELGEEQETPAQCSLLPDACFLALRRTGRLEEAVALYGKHVSQRTITASLWFTGRHEEVLSSEPRFPEFSAKALTALGRAEEAIERYPDHCACAYVALGRYQELLERFPWDSADPPIEVVYALHALGKTRELKSLSPKTFWQLNVAQIYTGPQAILSAGNPEAYFWVPLAQCLVTLQALREGNRPAAETTLRQIKGIRDPELWWLGHGSADVIVTSLLRGLLGDREHLLEDLREIVAHHKFKERQELWYDAAYLNGDITEPVYRRQPQQQDLVNRLTFIQAVAHDLDGRRADAQRAYRTFIEGTQPYPETNLLRHAFAAWRLG